MFIKKLYKNRFEKKKKNFLSKKYPLFHAFNNALMILLGVFIKHMIRSTEKIIILLIKSFFNYLFMC